MIKFDGNLIRRDLRDTQGPDSVKSRRKQLEKWGKDLPLLEHIERVWQNNEPFRIARARIRKFVYEDQWADVIEVNGKKMTYRDYLLKQGNVAIQLNQVKKKVETLSGVMVKNRLAPVAHAVDRNEQQYGELVTNGLQVNCDKNVFPTLKKQWMKELCLGGFAIAKESYDNYSGPAGGRLDSWTTYVHPNQFFYEGETIDPLFRDLTLVGQFMDKSFVQLASMVCKSRRDFDVLRTIYPTQADAFRQASPQEMTDRHEADEENFRTPIDPGMCRIYEVWTLESRGMVRLNDLQEGTEEVVAETDTEYLKAVKRENARRREAGRAAGWDNSEIPYILGDGYGNTEEEKNGYFVEKYWYCRILATDGTVLWEGESPYPDMGHPYSLCAWPFIDGKIVGYETDDVEYNLAMNRVYALHEWLLRTQAKGVTVVPKAIVPEDVSYSEFARSWTSIDDLVFIDLKPGMENMMPKVFYGSAQNFDAGSLLATLQRMMESGSPVNGAIQGNTPHSGTSGTLYEQMTANSATPIASLMEDFDKFIESVMIKKLKNILQFYDEERWRLIAGQVDGVLDSASLNLNKVGDVEFDLKVKESADSPIFRAAARQDAKEMLFRGIIDFEEFGLMTEFPFLDKILQRRQARQAEMSSPGNGGVAGPAPGGVATGPADNQPNPPVQRALPGMPPNL